MSIPSEILLSVTKPGRYTGGEVNAVSKPITPGLTRFAFCFPDAYEVGMSHLGLQLLYFLLNRRSDTFCERAFMPWPDMLAAMRTAHLPLFALETGDPLSAFDFLGFTLQYEMSYTNLLAMLDLAGLPLRARERNDAHPLVCAGGPCACNPEPLADFIDFFYIGDGEASLDDILERYRAHREKGGGRRDFLARITDIPGVYVPAFYDAAYGESGKLVSFAPNHPAAPARVRRAIIPDLADAFFPDTWITPLIEAVHDRAALEISRGCMRACRFCQAGYVYRPLRERPADKLLAQAQALLRSTGYEEISLLSLSACDHGQFETVVDGLLAHTARERVNISLPSLRLDSVSMAALQKTQTVRKSSLTFAPEAGSQRMRDVINKNLTESEILEGCERAFLAGFDKIKLYFMAGLPSETEADTRAVGELAERIVDVYYEKLPYEQRRRPVSVSVSTACFVPKPFTPFQWAAQTTAEAFAADQKEVKRQIRKRQITYRYHDAETAVVEGALARGDRRLGAVIEAAYRAGALFDGWTEHFNGALWRAAFNEAGLNIGFYTREREPDEILPWDFIDMGIRKDFLRREWERALRAETTPNCRDGCAGCGLMAYCKKEGTDI